MKKIKTKLKKLKGKTLIKTLFNKGNSLSISNLLVVYLKEENYSIFNYGVSVSKKTFKKAVDRNKIKRLLRECIRLYFKKNTDFFAKENVCMFIYRGNKIIDYNEIKNNIFILLDKLFQSK